MSNAVHACEPFETVMLRVAAELGAVANDLAGVENRVATILQGAPDRKNDVAQLQSLDRIGQQLRALEAFLASACTCRCGCVDVMRALGDVRLESVRARLAGETPAAAGGEVELW
jgi:hypothetical protein